jgi:hypothetical protein
MKAANNLWGGMEEVEEVGNRFFVRLSIWELREEY